MKHVNLKHGFFANFSGKHSGPTVADAGPNARPRRGAPLSSDFMTSTVLRSW